VFGTQLGIALDLPSLATIGRALGGTQRMMELSVSAYVVGVAAPILFWGMAADRYGRRATLHAALALFVACGAALVFVDDAVSFVALRLLQGIGGGGCSIVARIAVRDAWSGAALARRTALLSVSFIVAIGGGQLLGALLEAQASWRWGFALLAALGLVAFAASRGVTLAPGRPARPLREMAGTYAGLLAERPFLFPTLAGAASYAGLLTLQQQSPYLLETYFGTAATYLGEIGVMTAIAYLAGAAAVNFLVARTGTPFLLRAGALAATAAGGLVLALAATGPVALPAFVACYCLMSFGQAVIFPTSFTLATDEVGGRGAYATALCSFLQQILAGLGAAGVALLPQGGIATAAGAVALFGAVALALSRGR
jgi:predicted MFS family arabinose efflux permease